MPLITVSVTAEQITRNPRHKRKVSASPKIITPKMTAVKGSNAPRIAVFVGPIYWIPYVVVTNEMIDGINPSAKAQLHKDTVGSLCMSP